MTAGPPVASAITHMRPIPPSLRPLIFLAWLVLAIFAIVAQVGGMWAGLESDWLLSDLLLNFGIGLVTSVVLIFTATLLLRQRPEDPVTTLLSLSIVAAASFVGPTTLFFAAAGLEILEPILPSLWIGLLVAALPAFPNGRFVPTWSRWITISALPFTMLLTADVFTENEMVILGTTILGFGVALVTLAVAIIRFRRTPPGLERQQLKWAALGVSLCIAVLIAAIILSYAYDAEVFPEDWLPWIQVLLLAMRDVSFLILALGFLMSLLRLRLWDADRAIGRSAAYFLLTLILACVWAVSSTLVNDFVSSQVGGSNKGMVAAISTIIAALVFGPAREKVNGWVEKRLQRGVVLLRGLPTRLAIWQHLDDPAAFGARVAGSIAESMHAGRCAVLLFEDNGFRPLACVGCAPVDVSQWIAAQADFAELTYEESSDPVFPLRLILTDEEVLIGALLVGRRSDGSFFAKEERATLLGLEPALAAALNRVHTKVVTNRALAGIDQRLGKVEAAVATSG